MGIFLFILVVCSGLEVFGYPLVDVALLAGFLFLLVITNSKSIKIRINWLLIFCIYVIFQIFRGMYVLGDIRMNVRLLFKDLGMK
jgi:hypothetical protein